MTNVAVDRTALGSLVQILFPGTSPETQISKTLRKPKPLGLREKTGHPFSVKRPKNNNYPKE